MCTLTVAFESILAIILVPLAILQHITILMNDVLASQICGGSINRFEMCPNPIGLATLQWMLIESLNDSLPLHWALAMKTNFIRIAQQCVFAA